MKFNKPFSPMLLKEIDKPFDNENYLYEIKFDGIRATIHVNQNDIHIYSRNKVDITNLYPELKEIKKITKEDCIFDGEIVLLVNGVPSFSKLQERSHLKDKLKISNYVNNFPVCFIVFDILYKEKDLTNKKLLERKKILSTFKDNDYFIKTSYVIKEGKKLFKKIKEQELEGIVAKKIDSIYEIDTRTDNWIKIKNLKEESFYIGGYQDDPTIPMLKVYVGEYRNRKFYYVAKVMIGKKTGLYKKIKKEKVSKINPFVNFDEETLTYLKPKLICQIEYLERTKNNHLRHPVFKDL